MTYPSLRQSLVLAGTIGALLGAAWPTAAQQPAPAQQAAPLPPGSPLIGRPDTADAKRLAPVPAPPLAAAADKLPVDKLKAPKGFKVEVYASGMPNARSLALGDKGTVFVGSRLQDKVYAIVDKGGKREVKIIASGLYRPNGVAFKNGTLYIMELSQLSKIDNIEDKLDNPPKPTVILDGLPKDEAHGWKYIAIGPDNKLYFEIGQPCNNCLPPEGYGRPAFRLALLLSGQPAGSGIRLGSQVRGVHASDRADGTAHGGAGHEVLHRQFVSGEVQEPDPGCPPWLVEQDQQARRRRRAREHQEGWQRGPDRAVPHRLSREQQLCRAAGGRDGDEGRIGAGLRRLERRGLAGERRRQRPHRRALMDRGRGRTLPARSLQSRPVRYKERWS